MPAGDSSPFLRMREPLLEGRRIRDRAEAVPHGVRGKIDVHVPFEIAVFEPIEHVHCGLIERQGHLEGEVPVDLQNDAHGTLRTYQERESIRRALEGIPARDLPDVSLSHQTQAKRGAASPTGIAASL